MKKYYRINIKDVATGAYYVVQYRYWFWPFWFTSERSFGLPDGMFGWFRSVAAAEKAAHMHAAQHYGVKYLGVLTDKREQQIRKVIKIVTDENEAA